MAVSPLNPQIAVAASHDGRYPDGGAVGISYAWTHDGGRSWHHQPVPHLTSSTGGAAVWVRASDPVVAFGPDGDVYISTLLIALTCPSAVAVSRSTDGGRTFAAPVLAHYSATCDVSDDKNTLVVDTGATSPHRGRLYQFWTPFLTDPFGNRTARPRPWSTPTTTAGPGATPSRCPHRTANTQNSTAMVQPDGTVVDAYIDYGAQAQEDEDTQFRNHDASACPGPQSAFCRRWSVHPDRDLDQRRAQLPQRRRRHPRCRRRAGGYPVLPGRRDGRSEDRSALRGLELDRPEVGQGVLVPGRPALGCARHVVNRRLRVGGA